MNKGRGGFGCHGPFHLVTPSKKGCLLLPSRPVPLKAPGVRIHSPGPRAPCSQLFLSSRLKCIRWPPGRDPADDGERRRVGGLRQRRRIGLPSFVVTSLSPTEVPQTAQV